MIRHFWCGRSFPSLSVRFRRGKRDIALCRSLFRVVFEPERSRSPIEKHRSILCILHPSWTARARFFACFPTSNGISTAISLCLKLQAASARVSRIVRGGNISTRDRRELIQRLGGKNKTKNGKTRRLFPNSLSLSLSLPREKEREPEIERERAPPLSLSLSLGSLSCA